ncbi:MAG: UDP-N-acetylmuramoyl-L-alanine--D-glutamate ligase [Rhodospirillaceae bacterium]|nr:UDP-N-acetylmuramoyl-L-alanine--D-glutamate ligase [Rhodospirillaceae bacterium]
MIPLDFLAGQKVAVLGLGRSGLPTAEALARSGATVLAWDDDALQRQKAAAHGISVADLTTVDLTGIETMVLSPGIPRRLPAPHPAIDRMLAHGVDVRSDIDLLASAQPEARYLGVTGTNGKSTTTALIGHILRSAGVRAEVGGNLGTGACALEPLAAGQWYVLELSSYQLETVSLVAWDVGVFLNITPDHLDRYAGMEDYVAAKRRLFQVRKPGHVAVVGVDDDWCRMLADQLRAVGGDHRVVPVSVERPVADGVWVNDGRLVDDAYADRCGVMDLAQAPSLPGRHNWQNAAAAYAAARAVDIDAETIADAIRSFPGLRHRQQQVATVEGISFVNDSKATNPDAAAKALACYGPIYWIAGGRAKEGGLDELNPWLGSIAHAFLIGEATDKFDRYLAGRVPVSRCGTLDRAIAEAFAAARQAKAAGASGTPVVLLSPACASFDQFRSFEERGDRFVAAVGDLARRHGSSPGTQVTRGAA